MERTIPGESPLDESVPNCSVGTRFHRNWGAHTFDGVSFGLLAMPVPSDAVSFGDDECKVHS
jgi:hypothetical protein